jgi:hypothetical protein
MLLFSLLDKLFIEIFMNIHGALSITNETKLLKYAINSIHFSDVRHTQKTWRLKQ